MTDWRFEKKLGFGCMRLPMTENKEIDEDAFREMVDAFMREGFCYFDTARGYHGGKSETALKACLTSRYPRDSYFLVNKLSSPFFKTQEEILPFFESQLEACGVDYFDLYLMHAQEKSVFEQFKSCRAYETALELLEQGRIRHFGISFHDKASVLEEILVEYPQIEVVQIQFNYADYEDPSVQSRKVYEVCRRFGKPVIVMEPVKGGSLVRLPQEAQEVFDALGGSAASYAIRFAASFEGISMVLSGMGNMEMLRDNMSYMKDFVPLSEKEREAVARVCEIFRAQDIIPCTACGYCLAGCPMGIPIPDLFACFNARKTFQNWNTKYYYGIHTRKGGKASSCIGCGACEGICPQHLPIRDLLSDVVKEFEN
ncbi:MAG: aldo/keto reductase [Clostridia bacterium]|nr:aldo/keto reductase [Clostridia bacterium]